MKCVYEDKCALYGKPICTERCPLYIIYKTLLDISGIPNRYKDNTEKELDEFLLHYYNNLDKALDLNTGLYLYSKTTGTGKTFYASILANGFIKMFAKEYFNNNITNTVPVLFSKFSDFHNIYIQQFREDNLFNKYYLFKEKMINAIVLVIDDMGIRDLTDALSQELYEIINTRYERNALTIITSNVNRKQLNRVVGDRVYSRLCEMTKEYKIDGGDRRELF